jgi:hypothetical protein
MEDSSFQELRKMLESDFSEEEVVRYFKNKWNANVKSVKFVYDLKEMLPSFITIAKNSYMLSKLKEKVKK